MGTVRNSHYTHSHLLETDLCLTGPVADPSTLCPWCDETLPNNPSQSLLAMIAIARQRSFRAPRPGNRLGLRAEVPVFAGVCSAHELEKYDMVMALAEDWPTSVDWTVFITRIIALQSYLQRIVDDVDEEWQPEVDADEETINHQQISLVENPQALAARPRKESVIWKRLVNDIARRGRLHMAGALGQYGNFDRVLPG